MKISPRDRRNCLLLTALLVLCYGPAIHAWARGGWAFGEDAPGLFAPWRAFASSELRAGRWPLWNPWIFGGLPLALNGQAALGYPPNIVFWLLPFKTALLLDALAHSLVLGLGAYFLGRALGLSRTASCLLGLCLGANGAVSAHVYAGHVTWHAARAWLPWMLWALVRGLSTRRVRYAYALAGLFFLQFAAGYPPLALAGAGLCAGGFVAILALSMLAPRDRDSDPDLERADWMRRWLRDNLWAARWAAIALGLSAGLVASLALPLREVSGLSVHGSGLPWSEASELSGSWKSLARWFVPGLFNHARPLQWSISYGAHEEASAIGIWPTLLALGAPWLCAKMASRRRIGALWMLWIAMLGCVLLALGANTPLYRVLFENVSLFRILRFPVRWLEIWALLASIAAALTFDIWYRAGRECCREAQVASCKYLQRRLLLLGSVSLVVGALILGAACWLGTRSVAEFWRPLLLSIDSGRPPESHQKLALMLRGVALSECLLSVLWCLALSAVAWSARAALLRRLAKTPAPLSSERAGSATQIVQHWRQFVRPSASLFAGLAVVLVAAELGSLFWRSQRTWADSAEAGRPFVPPELAARYVKGERWVTSVNWQSINGGMSVGIEMLNGYDAMNTSAFWSLAQAIEGRAEWVDMYQPRRLGPALRIGGVTHALFHSHLSLGLPPWATLQGSVREWKLWRLFESRDVWPRLFLSSRVRSILTASEPDLVRALQEMAQAPTPAPNQDWPLLLMSSAANGAKNDGSAASTWGDSKDGSSGRVLSWSSRPNVLECEVRAERACWLGISQAWSPSWRAWIDGKPVTLERANGPFCALRLPQGTSRVRLAYVPQTWRWSSFVGLCALAMLGAGAGAFAARRGGASRR